MNGFGHNPDFLKDVLGKNQVMANVMTKSIPILEFTETLKANIRKGKKAYDKFIFMNSGSEANAVASRIADANAKDMIASGKYKGFKTRFLALKGGFHGRTFRPAQVSDSSAKKYKESLASFKHSQLVTVKPNDIKGLREVFKEAKKKKIFFEAMFIEPVMGEGRAGYSITPAFYKEARKLTEEYGTLLIVDSVQAGLRCNGVLSILDYPGFKKLPPPDMETFSKAINAGQYPLSILALNKKSTQIYKPGIYGNTMTANPRALDIGKAVMDHLDPVLRDKIVKNGKLFKSKLQALQKEFPDKILEVLGQGLLVSARLSNTIPVEGKGELEEQIRKLGVNIIHGSGNRLRFTPWFLINEVEINLILDCIKSTLLKRK